MSLLYMANDPKSGVPLVIKVLSPKFLSHKEMVKRFLKEAEIIALADHPNIVKLYGYGEWEQGLYIAMEYVQGISLRQYLSQNPLSLKKSLEMVLEIAYALCHLHTHGIIHRDVKPENVLVNESSHIKVIDFGIAQLIEPDRELNEENRARLIGTPVYMSPEQRSDPSSASYPSDIYSLGIIAYELILGKFCNGHVHLSLMPKGIQKILAKTLQKEPKARYLDIVDFISDITSYLHSTQFEKEKSAAGNAGEFFEKFQEVQQQLLPQMLPVPQQFQTGLMVHRPLGLSALYMEFFPDDNLFLIAEPSEKQIDGLISIIQFKGLAAALLKEKRSLNQFVEKLNSHIIASPFNSPLSCYFLKIEKDSPVVEWISCGYGSLWQLNETIQKKPCRFPALGFDAAAFFETEKFIPEPGSTLVICPPSEQEALFEEAQFLSLLEEVRTLPPQKLAETLYLKGKARHIHFFEEHPFVLLALHFPMEKNEPL